ETEDQTFTNNDGVPQHGAGDDPGATEAPPPKRPAPGVKPDASTTSPPVDSTSDAPPTESGSRE
ncbi:MAG: hypothetical protein WED11_02655, partial [Natronospirillum sp.]